MFINNFIKKDKLIAFQCHRLQSQIKNNEIELYKYIDKFFMEYCQYHNIDEDFILNCRSKFIKEYSNDLSKFEETGLYPYQLKKKNFHLNRIEYDLILIMSFLTEMYRFKIANWLSSQSFNKINLIIGCGPGVELGIIKEFCGYFENELIVYDKNPSPFVEKKFSLKIKKEYFKSNSFISTTFDNILLIEILEHLVNPIEFLKDVNKVLKKGKQIYLTTANNIPQFDHYYNFEVGEIKKIVKNLFLKIEYYEIFNHDYLFSNVKASNEVLVLTK